MRPTADQGSHVNVLRFPARLRPCARTSDAAIREQARIGLILDRLEDIWRDASALHDALVQIGIPLRHDVCETLSNARARIVCYPNTDDGDAWRATLRGVIEGLDVALLRGVSLAIDNPPITGPEDAA